MHQQLVNLVDIFRLPSTLRDFREPLRETREIHRLQWRQVLLAHEPPVSTSKNTISARYCGAEKHFRHHSPNQPDQKLVTRSRVQRVTVGTVFVTPKRSMPAAKQRDDRSGAIAGRHHGKILFHEPGSQLVVPERQPFATE